MPSPLTRLKMHVLMICTCVGMELFSSPTFPGSSLSSLKMESLLVGVQEVSFLLAYSLCAFLPE